MFIRFLKYIRGSENYDFDFILDNQTLLFGRDETIVKWNILKEVIDNNVDLSNRYKTFDGKVWDKVKELSEDLLFIHINISSSTCMSRIGNILDQFNISGHSVQIRLK